MLTTPPRPPWAKPPRLYEEVARHLTEAIVRGDYPPGAFLPTEQDLARTYGASRNVVREALKVLMARGLIEMLHGRGSRVLAHHHWRVQDQLVRLMRDDPQVPVDLLQLRQILEVDIAGLAARTATETQIAALQATIDQMRLLAGDLEACIQHDVQFHRLLAAATGNVLLPLVLEPVAQLLVASRQATIRNPGAVDRSVAAHARILARISAGDVDGARRAMQAHLEQVAGELRQIKEGST